MPQAIRLASKILSANPEMEQFPNLKSPIWASPMSARDHSHDRNRSERKAGRPRYGTLDGVCETNMEIQVKELTPC